MYDRAAICVRGPEAVLNFARELYENDQISNGWVDSDAQLHLSLDKFKNNPRNAQRYLHIMLAKHMLTLCVLLCY